MMIVPRHLHAWLGGPGTRLGGTGIRTNGEHVVIDVHLAGLLERQRRLEVVPGAELLFQAGEHDVVGARLELDGLALLDFEPVLAPTTPTGLSRRKLLMRLGGFAALPLLAACRNTR